MSENTTKPGGADRRRVRLSENFEVRDWAQRFGVTEKALRDAVARVGDNAEAVRRELGGQI